MLTNFRNSNGHGKININGNINWIVSAGTINNVNVYIIIIININ